MATFEEVYGMTLDEHIQQIKDRGEWTECHEFGHDLESPNNLVCRRCGQNFEPFVKEFATAAKEPKQIKIGRID